MWEKADNISTNIGQKNITRTREDEDTQREVKENEEGNNDR